MLQMRCEILCEIDHSRWHCKWQITIVIDFLMPITAGLYETHDEDNDLCALCKIGSYSILSV